MGSALIRWLNAPSGGWLARLRSWIPWHGQNGDATLAADLLTWDRVAESAQRLIHHAEPLTTPPIAADDDASCTACTETTHRKLSVTWTFRGHILERLDDYFLALRRMRRHDPEAYPFFGRLGFAVTEAFANPQYEDHQLFIAQRPSFGGVLGAFDPDDKTRDVFPTFIYFRKLKLHDHRWVERFTGDTYQVTVFYDDLRRLRVPASFHVGIHADGTPQVLLERRIHTHKVHTTHNGRRRKEVIELTSAQWQIPAWLFPDPQERDPNNQFGKPDPVSFALCLFRMAVHTYLAATDRIIVRAEKGGLIAAFGIELQRAPYFFRDRDKTLIAADGKRKRIFHSVIQHTRQIQSGRLTNVSAHYRGIRAFEWNAYGIQIVLPQNAEVMRMPLPMHVFRKEPTRGEWISDLETADTLVGVLNR